MIRVNGFNSDSETSHFAGVVMLSKMYPLIYRRPSFQTVLFSFTREKTVKDED